MNLNYLSISQGIGGKIKQSPDDFVVEEISSEGYICNSEYINLIIKKNPPDPKHSNKKYLYFILEKTRWTTEAAINEIANKLRVSSKRFRYAGTKDRQAHTTQICSVFGIDAPSLSGLNLKDIVLTPLYYADTPTNLGNLLGNHFKILLNLPDVSLDKSKYLQNNLARINKIYSELSGVFPNYFGEQRFGTTRKNTAKIGELIIKRKYEDAVMEFLTSTKGEINENARIARKELANTMNFKNALKFYPKFLKLELRMLAYLSKHPNDFIGALRSIPFQISLLFIHSFQSLLFNELLSKRLLIFKKENVFEKLDGEYYCSEEFGFPDISKKVAFNSNYNVTFYGGEDSPKNYNKPKKRFWLVGRLIGYETIPNEFESELLYNYGLAPSDFRIPSFPSLSSKGTPRTLFSPINSFSVSSENHQKNNIQSPRLNFDFSLQSGSYATMVLREFIDINKKKET